VLRGGAADGRAAKVFGNPVARVVVAIGKFFYQRADGSGIPFLKDPTEQLVHPVVAELIELLRLRIAVKLLRPSLELPIGGVIVIELRDGSAAGLLVQ